MASFTQDDKDTWFDACQHGEEDTLKRLLALGFNADERNRDNKNGLAEACDSGDGYKVITLLLDAMYEQHAQQPAKLLEALGSLGRMKEGLPEKLYWGRESAVGNVRTQRNLEKTYKEFVDALMADMRTNARAGRDVSMFLDGIEDWQEKQLDAAMERAKSQAQVTVIDQFRDRLKEVTAAATEAVKNGTPLPNAGGGQASTQSDTSVPIARSASPTPLKADKTLTLARLLETKPDGRTNLQIFAEQGQLADVFAPHIWYGRREEMEKAWEHVPEEHRAQVNIEGTRAHLDAHTVRERFRPQTGDDLSQGF